MNHQTVKFSVVYDGSALETNSMDVRDLGPAMMSLGNLFDEANRVINGNGKIIKLHVKAYSPGSFQILFDLLQNKEAVDLLTSQSVNAVINLKELIFGIGGGVAGLIWLIKKLKGKRPEKVKNLEDGNVEIEFEKITIQVPLKLMRLYQDLAVRKAAEDVLDPLKKEGIESFEVFEDKISLSKVVKEELSYFCCPIAEEEKILETEHEAAYSIVSVVFKEDNKWRLFDGINTLNVLIKDEIFLTKVENSEISFAKGDLLICNIKTKQWRTDSGLRTEHEVLEIKNHISAAKQLSLF